MKRERASQDVGAVEGRRGREKSPPVRNAKEPPEAGGPQVLPWGVWGRLARGIQTSTLGENGLRVCGHPPPRPSCTHRLRKGPSSSPHQCRAEEVGRGHSLEAESRREGGGLALVPEPTQISGLLPFRRQGTGPGGWDPADFGAAGHVRRSTLFITQWSRAAQLGWPHGIYRKEHEETPGSGEADTSLSHWPDTSWGWGCGYGYGLKHSRFLPALWSLHSFGGAERKKVRGPV